MDAAIASLVEQIHDTSRKLVLYITGGGSSAIADLLVVPGASRTVLEAVVPYSARSVDALLGGSPDHYCVASTARALAASAYHRARLLREGDEPVAGIGCTASLASDRPKRGEHRCHVAVHDEMSTSTYSLVLTKGARDRAGEEDVVSRIVLEAAARACGIEEKVSLALTGDEQIETLRTEAPPLLRQLAGGEVQRVVVLPDGSIESPGPEIQAVLPGSFNPLHEGHCGLAAVAREVLGLEVGFELSVTNVEKPPLDFTEIDLRLRQFAGRYPVVLTDAPTFAEKARLMPGAVFVVGVDTVERIVDPRFYEGDEARRDRALAKIADLGCRFLVAGRERDGRWQTLADVPVPPGFEGLFEGISEDVFRRDISSTALRGDRNKEA